MKITTAAKPKRIEMKPWLCAAWPRVGPTIASSTIRVGAGKEPAFKMFAKSFASSVVKLPEMEELPFGISSFTEGAEYTTLSNTMAILPFGDFAAASAVIFAQMRVPAAFIVMLTAGLACWSKSLRASLITSPVSFAFPERPNSRKCNSIASLPCWSLSGFADQKRPTVRGNWFLMSSRLKMALISAVSLMS